MYIPPAATTTASGLSLHSSKIPKLETGVVGTRGDRDNRGSMDRSAIILIILPLRDTVK